MSPTTLTADQRTRLRLTLLLSIPLAASILASLIILSSIVISATDRNAASIGQVMADQLALSSTEYILARDLLSLNVLLSNLVERGHVKGASIYSADNRLLVEAGATSAGGEQLFTAEIHYQDSIAGYVRIALDDSERTRTVRSAIVQILLVNLVLLIGAAWFSYRHARPLLARFETSSAPPHESGSDASIALPEPPVLTLESEGHEGLPSSAGDGEQGLTLLVMKLKPKRLAREIESAVNSAIALYQGEIIAQHDDEWTAKFTRGGDHCFQAICSGLVIQRLTARRAAGLSFNGGIHCGQSALPEDARATGKQAFYLASLGSGKLLATRTPFDQPAIIDRVEISEFHSFLAPDSQVYAIDALKEPYQGLIQRQAEKLAGGAGENGQRRRKRGELT